MKPTIESLLSVFKSNLLTPPQAASKPIVELFPREWTHIRKINFNQLIDRLNKLDGSHPTSLVVLESIQEVLGNHKSEEMAKHVILAMKNRSWIESNELYIRRNVKISP